MHRFVIKQFSIFCTIMTSYYRRDIRTPLIGNVYASSLGKLTKTRLFVDRVVIIEVRG